MIPTTNVLVVSDIHGLFELMEDTDQMVELLLGRAGKVPITEFVVRILAKQIPADESGRVDEVGFQVVVIRDFLVADQEESVGEYQFG